MFLAEDPVELSPGIAFVPSRKGVSFTIDETQLKEQDVNEGSGGEEKPLLEEDRTNGKDGKK